MKIKTIISHFLVLILGAFGGIVCNSLVTKDIVKFGDVYKFHDINLKRYKSDGINSEEADHLDLSFDSYSFLDIGKYIWNNEERYTILISNGDNNSMFSVLPRSSGIDGYVMYDPNADDLNQIGIAVFDPLINKFTNFHYGHVNGKHNFKGEIYTDHNIDGIFDSRLYFASNGEINSAKILLDNQWHETCQYSLRKYSATVMQNDKEMAFKFSFDSGKWNVVSCLP